MKGAGTQRNVPTLSGHDNDLLSQSLFWIEPTGYSRYAEWNSDDDLREDHSIG